MARLPIIANATDLDYLAAFQGLLPEGEVWPRDADAIQTRSILGLMGTVRRLGYRDGNLLVDSFPPETIELLPEWEATVGLPNQCTPLAATIQQRTNAVVSKMVGIGGQSIGYFISIALALGYVITITEFAPARAGILRAGQPIYGAGWASAWRVQALNSTSHHFSAGHAAAGEPLVVWGNAQLECALSAISPANTVMSFAYGVDNSIGVLGSFVLGQQTLVLFGTFSFALDKDMLI